MCESGWDWHQERGHVERLAREAEVVAARLQHHLGFSVKGQFTLLGHIPGGGRPLLREGAPISYQPRPEAAFPTPSPCYFRILVYLVIYDSE